MTFVLPPPTPHLKYACYSQRQRTVESFVENHVLMYFLCGTMTVFGAGGEERYGTGDTVFLARHQLLRCVKYPEPGGEFQVVSITFDQATLRALQPLVAPGPLRPLAERATVVQLPPHPLLAALAASVVAYQEGPAVAQWPLLKAQEALLLLLHLRPALQHTLFDFDAPGKVDLVRFMAQHFSFNVALSQFAYLTGRSLATFKRDFQKSFNCSPSRWLLLRRLEAAHYLLQVRQQKPTDVYLEVGFENLSHFSVAFKRHYGYAPSQVPEPLPHVPA